MSTIKFDDGTGSDIWQIREHAASQQVTVQLSEASDQTITVDYATDNADSFLSFAKTAIATNVDGAEDVYVADLDGDGDLDIVSASNLDDTIAWYENDGSINPSFTKNNSIFATS